MSKETDFSTFKKWLRDALRQIPRLYFQTPVAGQSGEEFRERIFCYELYHQLRCIFDQSNFGYWLCGELDKSGHPIIREGPKPDLVVHQPGDMDQNLCVLEIKPINGKDVGFRKDIATLTTFVRRYSYYAGILVVYGDIESGEAVIAAKIAKNPNALRNKGIYVWWIREAQARIVEL